MPGHGRPTGLPGALVVGEAHGCGLRYVGSVGTGWSDTERTTLAGLLEVAGIDECPFETAPGTAEARWVSPRSIGEARWVLPRSVGEARYATGIRAGLLRHPPWHRLWSADGTWERLLLQVQAAADAVGADAVGEVVWDISVDSTIVRAHQHAAGARTDPPSAPESKGPNCQITRAKSRGRVCTPVWWGWCGR
ncbi:hypothetical protein [Streptomyces sp. NPDC058240]|uniref:ATP dependent DNA ligase n=1 Tax=Streptomyces sp. NPDC058240 TaxID=3346396 RepID=UPI0036E59013